MAGRPPRHRRGHGHLGGGRRRPSVAHRGRRRGGGGRVSCRRWPRTAVRTGGARRRLRAHGRRAPTGVARRGTTAVLRGCDHPRRDDLARYRPQVEEARRDYFDMLERWWEEEGAPVRPDVVAVERHFEVDVGPHKIIGSIDRVDRRDGGLRIVDYKTGTKETPAAE